MSDLLSNIQFCYDRMDFSLLSSSVHGISQAKILGWVSMLSSKGSSQPRNQTWVFWTGRWILCCCCCSVAQLCPTLCNPLDCNTTGFPVFHHLPEFAQTHIHWVGNAIQPSQPLSSPSPPASVFSSIRVFPSELVVCIRWPKYWSISFSISPSNEHPGLISFRIDWLDLAIQGTLKSLLQHHSPKASILWRSAFFTVQLSHPYVTIGKTIALTRPLLPK